APARDLIRACWPGGLSLIVHQAPSLNWNLGHTRGTVMLRMPLHPVAIELLREVGPLAVSSANVSGQPPATTVTQARDQLGDSVAVYLDGGECSIGKPSTIVDLTGPGPRIVREGAITAERVGEVLRTDPATRPRAAATVAGPPPAWTVTQARAQLGASVAVYLDGGECSIGKPSTIVDLTGPGPRIVREGAITAERVGEVLGTDPATLRG